MKRRAVVFALLLASCGGANVDAVTGPVARVGAVFVPDAGGLGIEGSSERIDFGRSPGGVLGALDRELGPGKPLPLDDCPGDIAYQVAFGDLVLTFTDERFVGWRGPSGTAGLVCGKVA